MIYTKFQYTVKAMDSLCAFIWDLKKKKKKKKNFPLKVQMWRFYVQFTTKTNNMESWKTYQKAPSKVKNIERKLNKTKNVPIMKKVNI